MASADVRLKVDEPQHIRFAHSPLSALGFTLVSAGFACVCWRFITDTPGMRWALVFRFGRSVADADRAWLANACRYAAVHGHMPQPTSVSPASRAASRGT